MLHSLCTDKASTVNPIHFDSNLPLNHIYEGNSIFIHVVLFKLVLF